VLTDAILFGVAMVGSVAAAVVAVNHPQVGGLEALVSHPNVSDKLRFVPELDSSSEESLNLFFTLFFLPLAVQWWSMWYPGSEPGGGGYQAQRMFAARSERDAVGATLFFNVAHYAIRPWPWILVGLASLVVFPDLASLQDAFPNIEPDLVKNDLAYPAMLTFLPTGWRGLVLASLVAAYMSTISTHLNWGSSYLVNDFYQRFVNPEASQARLVWVARISTVCMMIAAAFFALKLKNALDAFQLILQIGAGTGLLFILRWFWWRINALSEVAAMVASFLVAMGLEFIPHTLADWQQLLLGVAVTTVSWLVVTWLTPPTAMDNLVEFCRRTNPGGPGWRAVKALDSPHPAPDIGSGLLNMLIASGGVYSILFGIGSLLYGWNGIGFCLLGFGLVSALVLKSRWETV